MTVQVVSFKPIFTAEKVTAVKVDKGEHTATGDGTTTDFTIPHNLGSLPDIACVMPSSSDAAAPFYVSITPNEIHVIYNTAPATGASLSWLYYVAKVES